MPYRIMDIRDAIVLVIKEMGEELLLHDNDRDTETALNLLEKKGYRVVSAFWNPQYEDLQTVLLYHDDAMPALG